MKKNCLFISLVLLLLVLSEVKADVKLPRLVSNGMVLQRDIPLKIWGWADPSEKVRVEFLGSTYKTKADKEGNWQVEITPTKAGGPYFLKVNDIEINDVLVGDVWLSSGQSNMELPVRRVMDLYAKEIKEVNNPNIRLFRSSSRTEFEEPLDDYSDGKWLPAGQEYIGEFSALAWFFAQYVNEEYNIPVGIISTAIGGSPAEAWLSSEKAAGYLKDWKKRKAQLDSLRAQRQLNGSVFDWSTEVNKNDPGVAKWSTSEVNVNDWPNISLPGYWSDKGVQLQHGSIWFYKEFEVADSLAMKEAILRLGRIIDSDSAFVNGVFVGTISYQYPPRIYNIPKVVLKPGKNKLMVRVFNRGGRGGFVEEKPYEIRIGTQVIDITGEWKYHLGAVLNPPPGVGSVGFMPGGLYNGLISPVERYGMKGVIWYQGESNTGRPQPYYSLFKDLIIDWRSCLQSPDLPFLFVQLANLDLPNKQPVENGWAELRDAQRCALELPNTGMAVTYDIGEWNDIHPLNKKEAARRLFLEAQRVAYNDTNVVSNGPLYDSMEIKEGSIMLSFKSVGSGLYANNLLRGFQIAGDDGHFVWANAVVISCNTIKVWSPSISTPKIVRYAWDCNPEGSNLKNKEGLLASPFTTERVSTK